MTPLAWMDGCVLPLGEARIALEDPGFLFGDGVFESLRVRRGRPFRWDLHARRLSEGLEVVGIDAGPLNLAQFAV
ncbi:MAG: D-amino acid aminotransferase, partial [Gammaproteobacteria bacterium]|nr:D-amino acid aminotransferase [Gammaproteobacteria bacterium]